MRTVVVYVHGLWLPGQESVLLRRRLARTLGAEARLFAYASVRSPLEDSVRALARFLEATDAAVLHLVAHSMGGLVLLRLFELGLDARLPPGRVVLIGSPVRGSCSARRLARLPFGPALLGRTAGEVLVPTGERRWHGGRDLGVIAGDLGAGLGRLLGPLVEANDGTVLVEETDLPGAADQVRLHVSHSGLVFSAAVAQQTAAFLREGRFVR
jgi:pimeloyl-ACP methyl ester carboxylesterase